MVITKLRKINKSGFNEFDGIRIDFNVQECEAFHQVFADYASLLERLQATRIGDDTYVQLYSDIHVRRITELISKLLKDRQINQVESMIMQEG